MLRFIPRQTVSIEMGEARMNNTGLDAIQYGGMAALRPQSRKVRQGGTDIGVYS